MNILKLLFYLFIICLDPFLLGAQDQDILWFNSVPMDREHGLTSGQYNDYTFQDSEGFVWISSITGLNRFDGHSVKQYHSDPEDSTSIYGENIQSDFFEDQNKNLWFCTYEAVHCYDRQADNFRHYFVKDETGKPIKSNYRVFYLENDSLLWLRADSFIYTLNTQRPNDDANRVFKTSYYHSYVGTDTQGKVQYIASLSNKDAGFEFVEFQEDTLKSNDIFYYKDKESGDSIEFCEAIIEDINNVWLTSQSGFFKWDGITKELQTIKRKANSYSGIYPLDSLHFLLSFNQNSLFKFNKNSLDISSYRLAPVHDPANKSKANIRNIFVDKDKNIWMSSPPNGLIYSNPKKAKFDAIFKHTFPESQRFDHFNKIIEYHDGTIWCSYNNGILIYNDKKELSNSFTTAEILPIEENIVTHMMKDQSGKIWVATIKGIAIYNPDSKQFQAIPSTQDIGFLYLYQLKNGKVLASTIQHGLFEITQIEDQFTVKEMPFKKGGYTCIYEDQLGQIYTAYEQSTINVLTQENDSFVFQHDLPIKGAINAFYETGNDSTLWIASGFGLAKIDKNNPTKAIRLFAIKDSFPDNNIIGILPKSETEFWVSTTKGLVVFNTLNHSIKPYYLEDGILSAQFSKHAYTKLSTGDIWMGGSNGITIIPQRLPRGIETKAKVLFTDLKINDEIAKGLSCQVTNSTNINLFEKIQLPYQDNTISLGIGTIDFSAPISTQIRYKLKGVDENWLYSEKGKTVLIRYPNLSSGEYQLIAEGANSEGQWGTQRILSINISTPFYRSWWFLTACFIGLFLIGWLIFKNRVNQIKKTSDLKTRIAENRMSALVAQMNPHFIFNSLQSINRYILKNDKRQASEYLGRFSKLMRMILENSRHSSYSLNQEIDLLSLYLKIEAQRFKVPFEYNITIDEMVDPYSVNIPAMILQPFVENAIWHGVSNKKEPGHIKIDISSKNNALKCVIEDDGVGRTKAAEIKNKKGKPHQSRALEIITERLKLLYPNQQDLCDIDYIDLFNKEKNPAGTRVEIYLPLRFKN